MKVLLISANRLKCPYPVYPIGLDYLSFALATAGHTVKIADLNTDDSDYFLHRMIQAFSPDVIGISIRNIDNIDSIHPQNYINEYKRLIQNIRHWSNAIIILGGSGFTLFPSEIMMALDADFGIMGEGEHTLISLLEALEKKNVSMIPGVITKTAISQNSVSVGQIFSRQFNPHESHVNFYLTHGGMLNLQTKRGCPFKCIYCTYPHIEGHKLRLVPPKEVAIMAKKLQDAGAKFFYITDSLFNSDDQHCIAIAQEFINARIHIPWAAFFGPKPTTKDFYKIMADAGLTHVEFGTETLSNKMLATYKKPFRCQDVFNAHQAARNAGLHIAHFFMLGGPGETLDTLQESFSNIERLDKCVLFLFCGIRIYPNTELYTIACKESQIAPNQNLLESVFYSPQSIPLGSIIQEVAYRAANHPNWVIGSDGKNIETTLNRMYKKGYVGPLWEKLIQ